MKEIVAIEQFFTILCVCMLRIVELFVKIEKILY